MTDFPHLPPRVERRQTKARGGQSISGSATARPASSSKPSSAAGRSRHAPVDAAEPANADEGGEAYVPLDFTDKIPVTVFTDDEDEDEVDDDFYTPLRPMRNRQPRRSKSADPAERRAAIHRKYSRKPHPPPKPPLHHSGSYSNLRDKVVVEEDNDDKMSTASGASTARSTQSIVSHAHSVAASTSSWRTDATIQEWYAHKREQEREKSKARLRKAHEELNWVLERRSAQISNFRKARREEEKEAKRQEQVTALKVAQAAAKFKAKLALGGGKWGAKLGKASAAAGQGGNDGRAQTAPAEQFAGDSVDSAEGFRPKLVGTLPWVQPPKSDKKHANKGTGAVASGGSVQSVWLGPGRFVSMVVAKDAEDEDAKAEDALNAALDAAHGRSGQ